MKNTAAIPGAKNKTRSIFYWIVTVLICFELVHGALWDFNLLNKGYVYGVLDHLGYPHYLATILGICKIVASVCFLMPGFLLLKEWAYTGIVILFSAACVSHLIVGDGPGVFIWSAVFAILTILSYLLRPASRRVLQQLAPAQQG
ncbi:MAG TPA: DoxX family protein [Chitinophagaceae bacterium]|nr:DoxX family protein [Chitinophagaceae bacterium]